MPAIDVISPTPTAPPQATSWRDLGWWALSLFVTSGMAYVVLELLATDAKKIPNATVAAAAVAIFKGLSDLLRLYTTGPAKTG